MVADVPQSNHYQDRTGAGSTIAARIAANVMAVRQHIAEIAQQCARRPEDIRLIAVTKSQTPDVIVPLQAAGIYELGENRLDHLDVMAAAAHALNINDAKSRANKAAEKAATDFHYIGRVQGRQLAKIIPTCSTLHSLCELDHIDRLGRACAAANKIMTVFLQVNTANDDDKAGLAPASLSAYLEAAHVYKHIQVVGLMTMAPLAASGEQADEYTVRSCFAALRELAQRHNLPRLSMGMSHDYDVAIREGASDIRVGTRLFE